MWFFQPRHGSGNYYSCVSGDYAPGSVSISFFSGKIVVCRVKKNEAIIVGGSVVGNIFYHSRQILNFLITHSEKNKLSNHLKKFRFVFFNGSQFHHLIVPLETISLSRSCSGSASLWKKPGSTLIWKVRDISNERRKQYEPK